MTDRNQFEAMLEALINEDQEQAKEIFHNIVVAKSREIYEELLSEDFDLEEANKDDDDGEEDKKEKNKKEDDDLDEAFGEEEEESEEEPEEEEDDVGGDASDDMIGDIEDDGEEDDSEDLSDEEQTDRILDLEDALEELKAEFEQLMAGEQGEEPAMGDEMSTEPELEMGGMDGMDAMGAPEEGDELQRFMEYVDKVALPKHGDNGANTKSIVAGKNDMGGTTANIAKGGEAKGEGTKGGLLNPAAKVDDAGNINKPGGNAGKTAFKKKEPGHGAEKKGSGDTAPDKKSLIGSR